MRQMFGTRTQLPRKQERFLAQIGINTETKKARKDLKIGKQWSLYQDDDSTRNI